MFFTTLLTFTIIKEIDKSKKKFNFYLRLYFISVFGALIHYYCIIYLIFLSFIFFILLLIERKWKSIILLIIIGILIGITVILIFPPMIKHIFYGYRGKQTFINLKQSKDKY